MDKIERMSYTRTIRRVVLLLGLLGLLVLGVSSCNLPDLGAILPVNSPTEMPQEALPTLTPQPTATPDIPLDQPRTLVVWVPPQFDPNADSEAAALFNAQLDEFVARRPQTDIQVRIKALSGDYGLLESLELTDAAAPILMPDLVALPRALLEQANNDDLLTPLNEFTGVFSGEDWFDYALDSARIDDTYLGIPFAGDLMVLAYKDDTGEDPPVNWQEVLTSGKAMAFPASDPRALVTLSLYQSLGGQVLDQEGNLLLESDPMLEILDYYQSAQAANVMPYWLTQFETDQQSWESYQERQTTLAVTWASLVLGSDSPNTGLAALPTQDGTGFSYGDGWVWCVIPSDPESEAFAVELAEFLADPDFLSAWTLESGYLPVRPSSLESWSDTAYASTLNQLLPFAKLVPDQALQDAIGPAIQDAVVSVLKDQVEPADALEVLMDQIPE